MSLLFVDGFDHYVTADTTKKWNSATGHSIDATAGRRGGGAIKTLNGTFAVTKTLTAGASWVIGFALKITSIYTSPLAILKLLDGGSVQIDLRTNADGTLSLTRNGTALTGGTSSSALSNDTWYYIELKVTIANSIAADSCKVRVNNVDWITVAAGQDTQATANASASVVSIGYAIGTTTAYYDDLFICDQAGSTNNNFLGDVRIDPLYPNGNGNYSQFLGSDGNSTDNYLLVDETAPNTTDYNDGNLVGDRDSYAFGNLAALTSQTVYGVQVNAAVLKDDAGAKSAATFARSGTTNSDGASVALGTSQSYVSQVYETNPNGGAAWTETAVNAAEFGVLVTA